MLTDPIELAAVTAGTSGGNISSGELSPTPGALLVVEVGIVNGSGDPGVISISDTFDDVGPWTVVQALDMEIHGVRNALAWAVAGSAPGSGVITATFSSASRRHLYVYEQEGQAETPVPEGQQITGKGGGSTLAIALPSAPAEGSMVFGGVNTQKDGDGITPGGGFTELTELQTGSTSTAYRVQAQYNLDPEDGVCDWSTLGSGRHVGVAIEVAAAPEPDPPASGGGGGYSWEDEYWFRMWSSELP